MTEKITIVLEYEITYENAKGRDDAIRVALEAPVECGGCGANGCYSATRKETKLQKEKK